MTKLSWLKYIPSRGSSKGLVKKFINKFIKRNSSKDIVFFYLLNKEEQQKHFKRVLDSYYQKRQKNHHNFNKISDNMNRDSAEPNGSRNDDSMSSFIFNKIAGAYKTTKESTYVRSIYNETSSAFNKIDTGYSTNNNFESMVKLPQNTQITLYPNYCKHENGEYVTRVKGIVYVTGIMSRKNKFLFSMARRIVKSNDNENDLDSDQIENEMKDAIVNQDRISNLKDDDDSTSMSMTAMPDDTVTSRMEGMLAKNISGTPLNVTIGSDESVDQLVGATLTTDNFGIFQMSLVTSYKPSYVAVSSVIDTSVLQTTTVEIVESSGVSVITDIDDTIRKTGVLGDKREVFRNIFSKPYTSCEVDGIADWYRQLHEEFNCPVHYVSNSPWQIFNVVYGFMTYFNFPITSIHLRQYSGNLVSSFTQPSAERKRSSLVALFNEFPNRKFILVGDTGEQDLEAYLSLIPHYPNQILAIYLRVVPTSLCLNGDDKAALKELNKMLRSRNNRNNDDDKYNKILKNPTGIDSDDSDDDRMYHNLRNTEPEDIGRSRRRSSLDAARSTIASAVNLTREVNRKLPPIVPRKPDSLRGRELLNSQAEKVEVMNVINNKIRKGKVEPRDDLQFDDLMENEYDANYIGNNTYGEVKSDIVDKRFIAWKARVRRIIDEVPEGVQFKFWEDVNAVKKDCIDIIIKELK